MRTFSLHLGSLWYSLPLIISTIVLNGCSNEESVQADWHYDTAAMNEAVVANFTQECAMAGLGGLCAPRYLAFSGVHIVKKFSAPPKEENVIAVCMRNDSLSTTWIEVSEEFTSAVGMFMYKAVLYHELFHCFLGVEHDPEAGHLMSAAPPFFRDDIEGHTLFNAEKARVWLQVLDKVRNSKETFQ